MKIITAIIIVVIFIAITTASVLGGIDIQKVDTTQKTMQGSQLQQAKIKTLRSK